MRHLFRLILSLTILTCALPVAAAELRVGLQAGITSTQALVAMDMAAEGHCWFAQRLPGVDIRWVPYTSDRANMNAVLEGKADMAYVGPMPVLTAHAAGKGNRLRVLSGAVRGGTALLVRKESGITVPNDLRGKRLATPQTGSTQDIACRTWLRSLGFEARVGDGDASRDVSLVPTAYPDQETQFLNGAVDAVWCMEPWISQLEMSVGGQILFSPPPEQTLTSVLVVSLQQLKVDPRTVDAFRAAHEELTNWIIHNPAEAQRRIYAQLRRLSRRLAPPPEVIARTYNRLQFTTAVSTSDFTEMLRLANEAGFLRGTTLMNDVVLQGPIALP